jgi:monovalent cation:H+ antiporter-2, CPA2 family
MLLPKSERHRLAEDERSIAQALHHLRNHVVICGFGRVGQNMAHFLSEPGFKYIALDTDPVRVRRGRQDGSEVYYGDATRHGILQAAGLKRAKALVVTFDHLPSALKVVHEARRLTPEVPIVVRAADDAALNRLRDAGATEVISEALEASVMLANRLLLVMKTPDDEIARRMRAIRADRSAL